MVNVKINAVVVSVPGEYIYRVAAVHRKAFGRENEAKLVTALAQTNTYIEGLSLAAAVDGRYVAHVMFSHMTVETGNGTIPALALAPLATLPKFRQLGLASHLLEYAIEKTRRHFTGYIIVAGDERFYERFGFEHAAKYGIVAPFPVPEENFLVLRCAMATVPSGGRAVYPPEFQCVTESILK